MNIITMKNLNVLAEIYKHHNKGEKPLNMSIISVKTGVTYSHIHELCKYYTSLNLIKISEMKGRHREVILTKKGVRASELITELNRLLKVKE